MGTTKLVLFCICVGFLFQTGYSTRKRSADYWVEYEPLAEEYKPNSRSEVNKNQNIYDNIVSQDTGTAINAVQQVQQSMQNISNTPIQPAARQVCHRELDLVIVMDSSYSLEGIAWDEEKNTVHSLIDRLDVTTNDTHVAVLVFSTDVMVAVPFNSYNDADELKRQVGAIQYIDGWSRTDQALLAAKYRVLTPNGGSRTGIPKAVVVLTDGRSDGEMPADKPVDWLSKLKASADELKQNGVQVFCIGTDDAENAELNVMASGQDHVFRALHINTLADKLKEMSKLVCYEEKSKTSPLQCPMPSCVFPSICLLAIQPTCLPPITPTTCATPGPCTTTCTSSCTPTTTSSTTCATPGVCTATETTTATSTALLTTTSIHTSTAVTTLSETETQTSTATETSTHTTTMTDTLTETATSTSTAIHTTTSTDTTTQTHHTTHTSTATTTTTLSTTNVDVLTSTHVTTATTTAIATSTALATRYVTSTLLTTSLDVDTSTHVTTATLTSTHVTTETDTSTAVTTATLTSTHVTTETDVSTEVTTATLTTTHVTTETETSTAVATATLTSTHVTTEIDTSTAVTTATETATLTTTKTALTTSTSTHHTTATITATQTSTAVATSTAVTTATDTQTQTQVLTTVETSTKSLTKTATATSIVMSTSIVTSCSMNCPSITPTPSLTVTPSSSISPPTPPPGCDKKMDIGLIVDASDSMTPEYFISLKIFLAKFISVFNVSPNGTHVGVITFAGESKINVKFNQREFYDSQRLQDKIKSLSSLGKDHWIDTPLEIANTGLFTDMDGHRNEIPSVLIVFTYRKGDTAKPYKDVIAPLLTKGINIIAVGLSNKIPNSELEEIANGVANNAFSVMQYGTLDNMQKDLTNKVCNTSLPGPGTKPCKGVVDLGFVVDGSDSINSQNFIKCKAFIKNMTASFEISQSLSHVGVVVFSRDASVVFNFKQYYDLLSIQNAVDRMPHPQMGTNIGKALEMAKTDLYDASSRRNVRHILIVMTDGKSLDAVDRPAQNLRDTGVIIYSLGIGKEYQLDQLNEMATDPDKDHVFTAGFDELATIMDLIKKKACNEALEPQPPPEKPSAKFTLVPSKISYVRVGMSARFVWEYEVNNRITAFSEHSPTWYLYTGNGQSVELAFEDKSTGWGWRPSPSCPASYKGRLSKEELATLVISNVATSDSAEYGCSLVMVSGSPIVSKTRLIAIDARFTQTPLQVIYATVGDDVRFEWAYTVDGGREAAFSRYSPTWILESSDGSEIELAYEDKDNAWSWSVSSQCPSSLAQRLRKESMATLVISKVTTADSGIYGCHLYMMSGSPVTSKVQLIVKAPTNIEVKFTKLPPREINVAVGQTVALEWEYTVHGEKTRAFTRYSPTWNLYHADGTNVSLAAEDMNNNWKWSVSPECPAKLRDRITKQSSAHLVISNVKATDGGTYGCSLNLAYTSPLIDKVNLLVTAPPCKAAVDLVFLIDGSGSIEQAGRGNFKRCLNFAKTMARNFDISKDGTHVGAVVFSRQTKLEFDLGQYYDLGSVEKAIDKIQNPEGGTYLGKGLEEVRDSIFLETGRSGVPHVLIVMTDGRSSDDVVGPSTALKKDGTLIYALGVGNDYSLYQLKLIASTPTSEHVFVSGFQDLEKVAQSIKNNACSEVSETHSED